MKTTASQQSPKAQSKVTMLLGTGLALVIGAVVGLAGFTFVYAKGGSYLGNDPASCANCHVMQDHLDAYVKSSHHAVATCNDCHTPPGLVAKYLTKAEHGFFHSLAFTTGNFHDPIQIKERSRRVTENSCRKCHQDVVHDIDTAATPDATLSCIRCHASVGHLQ